MHSPATSTSTLPTVVNHDIDQISAYYSLAFPNFTYYLQTLTVTIGRRPIPSAGSSSDASLADVDLGPLKSVSRLHARIEYEEDDERFVLVVLGRNGAWVDGIWAGTGSKVPLSSRSQIQIATRTFHFILPPAPPAPESSSLSSPPSTARQRSPSVDITSLSPSSSRSASPKPKPATAPRSRNLTAKPTKVSKKRKRPQHDLVLPENMPPKPVVTYAVMCYRAITSLGGKATLQDVVQWMIDNYEWYRLNVGGPWENSIRHNLSSNRAFRNAPKSSEDRGKGFLWSIDPSFESLLRDQDAKARLAEQAQRQNRAAAGSAAKAESKLPQQPPLTREPRVNLVYVKKENKVPGPITKIPSTASTAQTTVALAANAPDSSSLPSSATPNTLGKSTSTVPSMPQIPPNVTLPIVVGPVPDQHPSASATAAALAASSTSTSAALTAPPIVLHSGTLILNPTIFSHLTSPQLKELEGLGAQKALEILQCHIIRFLKEKKKLERSKGRGQARGRGRGGAAGGASRDGRKDRAIPEVNADVTDNVFGGEDHIDGEKGGPLFSTGIETSKSPLTTPLVHLNAMNGVEIKEEDGEPAAKKRKLDNDNAESLDGIGNGDGEIDVVGT